MEHASPDLYQPPLTRWGHVWRTAVMLLVSIITSISPLPVAWRKDHWLVVADLLLGLTGFVLVWFRRRYPMPVATVITVFGFISSTASGPGVLAAVSLATRRVWWQLVVIAAINMAASYTYNMIVPTPDNGPWWVNLLVVVVVSVAILGWGAYIGSRRELLWTLKNRAERAEAEQELRTSQARANERASIAREMHDVLAHRISQVSMHASALAFRTDLDADEMRASATIIQDTAHEALADLRSVLGVLRDPETGKPLEPPQPTYRDLEPLIEAVRSAGLKVSYDDRLGGAASELPDVIGRTVYRIVQEGMTNAAKHAPGTSLLIVVSGSPDEGVTVELRNPLGLRAGSTPGAGLGLVGLTERAELRGGRLEGRREDGAWVLRGWIPWAA
ncbi:sensor histidine kinase [Nocardioides sp.]|uniref:sensor histidine kinase n=1 Tax=Nocardioides sp. TaxID=35761 RepID=UPI002F41A726